MSKILQVALISASLVTLNGDAQNLSVSFDLNPSVTLPALPVSMRLTIKNEGASAVAIPRNAILIATPENGGTPMIVRSEGVRSVMYDIHALDAPLQPHATQVIDIEADGSLNRPYWFQEDVFAHPGQYELQILLGTAISGNTIEEARSTAVASATARLTVNEPRGTDAQVWKELRGATIPSRFTPAFWPALAREMTLPRRPRFSQTGLPLPVPTTGPNGGCSR